MNKCYGAWSLGLFASIMGLSIHARSLVDVDLAPSLGRLHAKHTTLACGDCHSEGHPSAATLAAQTDDKTCQSCHGKNKTTPEEALRAPSKHPPFSQENECKSCHKTR